VSSFSKNPTKEEGNKVTTTREEKDEGRGGDLTPRKKPTS
jgi:hypothetical protein